MLAIIATVFFFSCTFFCLLTEEQWTYTLFPSSSIPFPAKEWKQLDYALIIYPDVPFLRNVRSTFWFIVQWFMVLSSSLTIPSTENIKTQLRNRRAASYSLLSQELGDFHPEGPGWFLTLTAALQTQAVGLKQNTLRSNLVAEQRMWQAGVLLVAGNLFSSKENWGACSHA